MALSDSAQVEPSPGVPCLLGISVLHTAPAVTSAVHAFVTPYRCPAPWCSGLCRSRACAGVPGPMVLPGLVHARPQPDPNRHVAFAQLFGPPGWVRSVLSVQCISSSSSHCNYTIVSVLLYCSSVEPNRNSTRGIVLAYSLAAQGTSKEQTFSKYF